jgi:hypothetical protein
MKSQTQVGRTQMTDEVLRDHHGKKIGTISKAGLQQVVKNAAGLKLGTYNTSNDTTYDKNGAVVGTGNLLATLLK